jgi:hypothetical protein
LCMVWHDPAIPQSTIDGDAAKGIRKNIQQAGIPDGHPL